MLPDTNKKEKKSKEENNNSKDQCKIICNHEFIKDDIDLTPDRSQRIVYCTKCFITKS
jgi:hypothetical protein